MCLGVAYDFDLLFGVSGTGYRTMHLNPNHAGRMVRGDEGDGGGETATERFMCGWGDCDPDCFWPPRAFLAVGRKRKGAVAGVWWRGEKSKNGDDTDGECGALGSTGLLFGPKEEGVRTIQPEALVI